MEYFRFKLNQTAQSLKYISVNSLLPVYRFVDHIPIGICKLGETSAKILSQSTFKKLNLVIIYFSSANVKGWCYFQVGLYD